jgi:hypothetical protein
MPQACASRVLKKTGEATIARDPLRARLDRERRKPRLAQNPPPARVGINAAAANDVPVPLARSMS